MAELFTDEKFGNDFHVHILSNNWSTVYLYKEIPWRGFFKQKKMETQIYMYQQKKMFTIQAKNNKLMNMYGMYNNSCGKTTCLYIIKVWRDSTTGNKTYFGKICNQVLNVIGSGIMTAA